LFLDWWRRFLLRPLFDIAVELVAVACFLGGHLCRRFSLQLFLPRHRAAPRHAAHCRPERSKGSRFIVPIARLSL
jgi:hypothetical protein